MKLMIQISSIMPEKFNKILAYCEMCMQKRQYNHRFCARFIYFFQLFVCFQIQTMLLLVTATRYFPVQLTATLSTTMSYTSRRSFRLRSRFMSVMSGQSRIVKGCTSLFCSFACIASLRLYSHRAPRSSPQTSRPATKY